MRILIVDDDKFNLKVANDLLTNFFSDHEVITCNRPQDALVIIDQERIDLILLDIVMPGYTGIDILKVIRAQPAHKNLPIIMLTSSDDIRYFMESFELGANDYIFKPINPIDFRARIQSALKVREQTLISENLVKDIKEQNQKLLLLNQKLKDTQFHLFQSEKMAAIGQLASGVAHEINNPLGYVGSNMETLASYVKKIKKYIDAYHQEMDNIKKSSLSPGAINSLGKINHTYQELKIPFILDDLDQLLLETNDGIFRVAQIVETLRNFARSGIEDTKTMCSLENILSQTLLMINNEVKYIADILIEGNEPLEVWGNKVQLSQVFLNIAVNAVQAIKVANKNERGLIKIDIYPENDYACISITDNGIGLSERDQRKVFEPFFTTKEVGQGTGLGLSISYDIIVNKHNGQIDLTSIEGEGATVTIKLPRYSLDTEV